MGYVSSLPVLLVTALAASTTLFGATGVEAWKPRRGYGKRFLRGRNYREHTCEVLADCPAVPEHPPRFFKHCRPKKCTRKGKCVYRCTLRPQKPPPTKPPQCSTDEDCRPSPEVTADCGSFTFGCQQPNRICLFVCNPRDEDPPREVEEPDDSGEKIPEDDEEALCKANPDCECIRNEDCDVPDDDKKNCANFSFECNDGKCARSCVPIDDEEAQCKANPKCECTKNDDCDVPDEEKEGCASFNFKCGNGRCSRECVPPDDEEAQCEANPDCECTKDEDCTNPELEKTCAVFSATCSSGTCLFACAPRQRPVQTRH